MNLQCNVKLADRNTPLPPPTIELMMDQCGHFWGNQYIKKVGMDHNLLLIILTFVNS